MLKTIERKINMTDRQQPTTNTKLQAFLTYNLDKQVKNGAG